jgi:hypothetical protein
MDPPVATTSVVALVSGVPGAVSWATATAAAKPIALPGHAAVLAAVSVIVRSPNARAVLETLTRNVSMLPAIANLHVWQVSILYGWARG